MSLTKLNRSVTSPLIAFPAIWVLGALLSQIHLLHSETPWSTVMIVVICVVPISFIAGGLIGEALALRVIPFSTVRSRAEKSHTVRIMLVAMLAIGLAELIHQFIRTGAIPLLSGSIDQARFGQGGPTILLVNFLTVAIIVALTAPQDLRARESRFEVCIALVALAALALQAGRGTLLLPVLVAVVARWIYWGRPPMWFLLGGGLLALFVISLFFFLRAEQHPTTPFEAELFTEVIPPLPLFVKPLVPLCLAITTNFLALQAIIGHFPTVAPFGHGAFSAHGIDYFIPSAQNLGGVSSELTSPWVTSTVVGPLWADGGFPVVVTGVALTGTLSAGAYGAASRTQTLRWAMVAAFLLYLAVFGVYTSLWTEHVDWLVITPALLIVGAVIEDPESPPGVTGQVLSRLSKHFKHPTGSGLGAGGKWNLGWKLVAGSLLVIATLIVLGISVEDTLPEPYPRAFATSLPPSARTASVFMTDSDHNNDNAALTWINRKGQNLAVTSLDLNFSPPKVMKYPIHLPKSFAHAHYDISTWAPLRGPALFVMAQRKKSLDILIMSVQTGRTVDRLHAPISAPLPGIHRDLEVTTYSGPRPDLYVVDRGSTQSRVQIVAVSGESRFHRRLLDAFLPFRGVYPAKWAVDIGPISVPPPAASGKPEQPQPDVLFIEHNAAHINSIARILLGEEDLRGFSSQRALDAPGNFSGKVHFLLGSYRGAAAVYMVTSSNEAKPWLSIFLLQPLPAIY